MRWLLLMLLLAGCTSQPPAGPVAAAAPDACHTDEQGGPLPATVTDRGIGGTGGPGTRTTDRGIGGTGIVGVITGFGSVCVAGEEVALPAGLVPVIDGQPASTADLRAGQFAAVAASPTNQAISINVTHLVVGPVQPQATPTPGTLLVAGQIVHTEQAIGSAAEASLGEWVAVSGLRAPDGTITASRIDPAPPGRVLLHGAWPTAYEAPQIGGLTIRLPPDAVPPPAGFPVIVTGTLEGSVLLADSIIADPAADNPALYFPPQIDSFVVEGYVAVISGGLLLDHAFISGSTFGQIGALDRGIARFRRGGDGRLFGIDLRGLRGGFGGRRFGPARLPGTGFLNGVRGGRGGGGQGYGGFRPGGAFFGRH